MRFWCISTPKKKRNEKTTFFFNEPNEIAEHIEVRMENETIWIYKKMVSTLIYQIPFCYLNDSFA